MANAALFAFLAVALGGVAVASATAGQWVIAGSAAVIGAWLGSLAVSALRRTRR